MIRLIKDLKWLSQNKEKLKELLDKQNKQKNNDKNYSLAGVPEYQLDYINDILEADENKK
jgi:hypothetical protein